MGHCTRVVGTKELVSLLPVVCPKCGHKREFLVAGTVVTSVSARVSEDSGLEMLEAEGFFPRTQELDELFIDKWECPGCGYSEKLRYEGERNHFVEWNRRND